MKELLVILTLAAVLTIVVLISLGVFKRKKPTTNDSQSNLDNPDDEIRRKYGIPKNDNYILPAEFNVGLIKQKKPTFMNNCNPGVLYPINGLGPDYGWKMPKDCRCTEFVQAP